MERRGKKLQKFKGANNPTRKNTLISILKKSPVNNHKETGHSNSEQPLVIERSQNKKDDIPSTSKSSNYSVLALSEQKIIDIVNHSTSQIREPSKSELLVNELKTEVDLMNPETEQLLNNIGADNYQPVSLNIAESMLVNSLKDEINILNSDEHLESDVKCTLPHDSVLNVSCTPLTKSSPKSSFNVTPPKTPSFFIRNLKGKLDGKTSGVLVYKLGSQSTPRKICKSRHTDCYTTKSKMRSSEFDYVHKRRYSLPHTVTSKTVIGKSLLNKRKLELLQATLVKPVQYPFREITSSDRTPKSVKIRDLAPKFTSESKTTHTEEIFKMTPVKTLVNQFELLSKSENTRNIKTKSVTINIHEQPIRKLNIPTFDKGNASSTPSAAKFKRESAVNQNKIDNSSSLNCKRKIIDDNVSDSNIKTIFVEIVPTYKRMKQQNLGLTSSSAIHLPSQIGNTQNITSTAPIDPENIVPGTSYLGGNSVVDQDPQINSTVDIYNQEQKTEYISETGDLNSSEKVENQNYFKSSVTWKVNEHYKNIRHTTLDDTSSRDDQNMEDENRVMMLDDTSSRDDQNIEDENPLKSDSLSKVFKDDTCNSASNDKPSLENKENVDNNENFETYFTVPKLKTLSTDVYKHVEHDDYLETGTERSNLDGSDNRGKEIKHFIRVYEDDLCNETVSNLNKSETVTSQNVPPVLPPAKEKVEFCFRDEDFPPLVSPQKNTIFID